MKHELVRDWMISDVITIEPHTTLPEADRLMVEMRVRRLPVVKNGHLVGIVTRNNLREAAPSDDIALNIHELHFLIARLTIARVMTIDPITISPNATIAEAVELMYSHKVSGLPVLGEGKKLIGIVTESDIFRMIAEDWRKERIMVP
jgi:acetoin utilization protein AcuB